MTITQHNLIKEYILAIILSAHARPAVPWSCQWNVVQQRDSRTDYSIVNNHSIFYWSQYASEQVEKILMN